MNEVITDKDKEYEAMEQASVRVIDSLDRMADSVA